MPFSNDNTYSLTSATQKYNTMIKNHMTMTQSNVTLSTQRKCNFHISIDLLSESHFNDHISNNFYLNFQLTQVFYIIPFEISRIVCFIIRYILLI